MTMETPDIIHNWLYAARQELAEKLEEQLSKFPPDLVQLWVDQGYTLVYDQKFEDGKLVLSAELRKV